MTLRLRTTLAFLCTLSAIPEIIGAQSLDLLTPNHVGVSIGDSRRVTGLRINFRDRRMEEVNGVNITVWQPYRENRGIVNGLALGVPMTGAQRITGIGAGIFGVAANESIHGLGIGGIGIGAGQDIEGIGIGGIGMGVGRDIHGIGIGGIGMGIRRRPLATGRCRARSTRGRCGAGADIWSGIAGNGLRRDPR